MLSILHVCKHFFIAYIIKPELHSEIGAIDVNQRYQISVDII